MTRNEHRRGEEGGGEKKKTFSHGGGGGENEPLVFIFRLILFTFCVLPGKREGSV